MIIVRVVVDVYAGGLSIADPLGSCQRYRN
jgi:hypothetical protein